MKKKTTEARVAEEALQKPSQITIAGHTYEVEPPTTATIIMLSEEISTLPDMDLKSDTLVEDCLREAKHCRAIGRAVAVMILGARKAQERPENNERGLRGIFYRLRKNNAGKSDFERLADELLDSVSPSELQSAFTVLLTRMQLGDFFALTTFLNGINTTKPTREVGN